MATVHAKLEGARFSRTKDGDELTVPYKISGLTSAGLGKISEAIGLAGVPDVGDTLSTFSSLYVSAIRVTKSDSKVVELDVVYVGRQGIDSDFGFGTGSGDTVEIGASLISTQVNTKADGTTIKVGYTNAQGVEDEQSGFISKLQPQMTLTFVKVNTDRPDDDAREYVGRVNSDPWLDGEVGEWLCTSIRGRSPNWGQSWEVAYSFQYDPDDWNSQKLVYEDPETGRPPPDVEEGNGITTVTGIYEGVSFGGLQLI